MLLNPRFGLRIFYWNQTSSSGLKRTRFDESDLERRVGICESAVQWERVSFSPAGSPEWQAIVLSDRRFEQKFEILSTNSRFGSFIKRSVQIVDRHFPFLWFHRSNISSAEEVARNSIKDSREIVFKFRSSFRFLIQKFFWRANGSKCINRKLLGCQKLVIYLAASALSNILEKVWEQQCC